MGKDKSNKHAAKSTVFDYIIYFFICIIVAFILLVIAGFVIRVSDSKNNLGESISKKSKASTSESSEVKEEPETFDKLEIVATGDIMCHNTQFNDAYKGGTYDFHYWFEDIKPYIEEADIAIGNLETTFPGNGKYSGYPQFNTPGELITALKDTGFDVLTTANNHCVDTGYAGVEGTLNSLDEAGILHTGTARSEEERDTVLITEVNNFKIAIISYTYGTNGIPIPKGKDYSVNLIDNDLIKKHIEKAKEQNPDLIIACMHWGLEYMKAPVAAQTEEADFLFENGVDIIIGNHPHVLEPYEKRTIEYEGKEKEVFVVYSLGNLISGQTQEGTRTSILLTLDLEKSSKTGNVTLSSVDYIPVYTYTNPKFKNYQIMDITKRIYAYDAGDTSIAKSYIDTFRNELQKVNDMYNK